MEETTEPTREWIEKCIRELDSALVGAKNAAFVSDMRRDLGAYRMALRTMDAEVQLAAMADRAEKAERELASVDAMLHVGGAGAAFREEMIRSVRARLETSERDRDEARAKLAEAERLHESERQVGECENASHAFAIRELQIERSISHERRMESHQLGVNLHLARIERDDARTEFAAMTERADRAERERDEATKRAELAERDLADCAASVAHAGESAVMDGGLAENVPASVGLALQRMKARAEKAERERYEALSASDRITAMVGEANELFVGYDDPSVAVRALVDDYRSDVITRTLLRESLVETRTKLANAERHIADLERELDAERERALMRRHGYDELMTACHRADKSELEAIDLRARLAAAERRLAEVERERDDAASEAAAHNAAAAQYEKDIADLRAKLAGAEARATYMPTERAEKAEEEEEEEDLDRARKHRCHPSYQETTMTETTEPTREWIESCMSDDWPAMLRHREDTRLFRTICAMALRTLDAEDAARHWKRLRKGAEADRAAMATRAETAESALRDLKPWHDQVMARHAEIRDVEAQLAAMEERAEMAEADRAASIDAVVARATASLTDRLVAAEERAEKAERERDEAASEAAAHDAAATQYEKDIADLRTGLAAAERERDEARGDLESMTGLYNTAWPALDSARAERDAARAKLAERERYIAEQRAITEPSVQDLARQLREATERAEKAERERGATSAALNDLASGLRDALNGFAMVGEKWTDAVKRLRKQLAEVEREQDEANERAERAERAELKLAEACADWKREWEALRIVERELCEARQERDNAEDEAAAHNAAATQYEKDIADLRVRLAEVERERDEARSRIVEQIKKSLPHAMENAKAVYKYDGNESRARAMAVLIVDEALQCLHFDDMQEYIRAKLAEFSRAKLAAMHRRAQRAESATADARREAIGQRMRADWWRSEAKRLGWTPTIQPVASERLNDLIEAARHVEMSPEQREAQRRSFAYGNVAIENPSVTREHIDVAAARIDFESSSLLLLSTWARRVMMRPKNRAKGVPSESVEELIVMARDELFEASDAIGAGAPTDYILAELGDAAAIIGFAMREIEKRRTA